MKNLIVTAVVIAAVILGFGFYRGWFEATVNKDDASHRAGINVNANKFNDDKDHFQKFLAEKSKVMKEKLASLKDKSKDLTGDAKAKAEQEIDALTKNHESIESKLKEAQEATEEKLSGLKKSFADEYKEKVGPTETKLR